MPDFFRMTFDEGELEATELAITANPAIEVLDGVFLNKENNFIQLEELIELNSEKQIIASVALRADKWIERMTKEGETYYIMFEPKSVKSFKENFEKNGAVFNIEHSDRKVKAELIFSEIVEEVGEEKIREEFGYKGRLEKTDYFVAAKIENKEDWEYIKKEGMNAFSIEAYFNKHKIEFKKETMTQKEMMEQIEELKSQLAKYQEEEKEETTATEETKEEKEEIVAEVKTEETETEVEEVEEGFVFTEEMYKDLIQKVAELEVMIEEKHSSTKDVEMEEKVEMNKNMTNPAKFLKGLWS
jgi:hypothetical protein